MELGKNFVQVEEVVLVVQALTDITIKNKVESIGGIKISLNTREKEKVIVNLGNEKELAELKKTFGD